MSSPPGISPATALTSTAGATSTGARATAGLRTCSNLLSIPCVASFSISFLGCKVSHVDAHELRERLLADGHVERDDADVAVVNTCCVTHEAVSKSRKEAARAARTHRRVFVTGCGANLARDAFAGLPDNVVVVARRSEETPDFVASEVGVIGCVQADARLDRVR